MIYFFGTLVGYKFFNDNLQENLERVDRSLYHMKDFHEYMHLYEENDFIVIDLSFIDEDKNYIIDELIKIKKNMIPKIVIFSLKKSKIDRIIRALVINQFFDFIFANNISSFKSCTEQCFSENGTSYTMAQKYLSKMGLIQKLGIGR